MNQLRVAYVATYPPRHCGIATFTADLVRSVGLPATVLAMEPRPEALTYPPEVRLVLSRESLVDYGMAARFLNDSDVDVVCVQHEFGIFGGATGSHILEFLGQLQKPVVVTLHTIGTNPSPDEVRVTRRLAGLADRLVVLTELGRRLLDDNYDITGEKVELIYHGVPDVPFMGTHKFRQALGMHDRQVLATFGLINRGKGIEQVIEAMPQVVAKHPDALYLIIGATHPEVLRHEGESYRNSLKDMIADLGLSGHVGFVNQYLDLPELLSYLKATDVYVTPYPGLNQIASGALAYAVGCGKAIVSTPYLYAQELLAEGRGVLVPFGEAGAMGDAINRILDHPEIRTDLETRAYDFGRRMIWSEVGDQYASVFAEVVSAGRNRGAALVAAEAS